MVQVSDLVEGRCDQYPLQLVLVNVHHDLRAVDSPLKGTHAFLQRVQAMKVVGCSDYDMLCSCLLPFEEKIPLNSPPMKHFSTVTEKNKLQLNRLSRFLQVW